MLLKIFENNFIFYRVYRTYIIVLGKFDGRKRWEVGVLNETNASCVTLAKLRAILRKFILKYIVKY